MNPAASRATSILTLPAQCWRGRYLIVTMTKREILGRYKGSVLGLAWSFFHPLIMLAIYTFIFSVVFRARWDTGAEDSTGQFAVFAFTGMIVVGFFAECVNRACSLIVSHQNYVKKLIFPLEILPLVTVGAALFHAAVGVLALLAVRLALAHSLPWTALLLPVVLVPLFLGTLGCVWLLAAVGVYVRDMGEVTTVLTSMLMFASPVFFPLKALPEKYRFLMELNPLTWVIEASRAVLIDGAMFDPAGWLLLTGLGLGLAAFGLWFFQKARNGFADVI